MNLTKGVGLEASKTKETPKAFVHRDITATVRQTSFDFLPPLHFLVCK
uniref:Uncharacterized protein n=1 Tax=Trypanosoma brucei TaxID=5691 RepID=Q581P7_9TRYP|nr:hypothetical protein, unlikely [Trypanosoma brucei]